jgi:hypothetical protein
MAGYETRIDVIGILLMSKPTYQANKKEWIQKDLLYSSKNTMP